MAWDVASVGADLLRCEDERVDRAPFTDEWPELDLATGYEIQDRNLQARLDRGETLVGIKLGLTSKAKQQRMGIDVPFVAWLTDAMVLPAGDPVPQSRLIHPRIEPEIVFVMGRELTGPGVSCATAMRAVESVWGGAEIIDPHRNVGRAISQWNPLRVKKKPLLARDREHSLTRCGKTQAITSIGTRPNPNAFH